jgi:hypothetical protein
MAVASSLHPGHCIPAYADVSPTCMDSQRDSLHVWGACAGEDVKDLLHEHQEPPASTVLEFHAVRLKTDLQPEPFILQVGEGQPCCVKLLWLYWAVCIEEGQPLQDVLFRPLSPDGTRFLEKLSSCSAYNQRVKKHFGAVGVPYNACPHGSRRGTVQAAGHRGVGDEGIANLARIKTAKVRAWYADEQRHTGGSLPRVKRTSARL